VGLCLWECVSLFVWSDVSKPLWSKIVDCVKLGVRIIDSSHEDGSSSLDQDTSHWSWYFLCSNNGFCELVWCCCVHSNEVRWFIWLSIVRMCSFGVIRSSCRHHIRVWWQCHYNLLVVSIPWESFTTFDWWEDDTKRLLQTLQSWCLLTTMEVQRICWIVDWRPVSMVTLLQSTHLHWCWWYSFDHRCLQEDKPPLLTVWHHSWWSNNLH